MSKLSDRFQKENIIVNEPQIIIEDKSLTDDLLKKVNSVPYWNEYTIEQQRDMVRFFVKNSDTEDKETVYEILIPYVTGFGALQKLLDNENVSAVFVNDDKSVHIEIDGNAYDAEMLLSENMLQYILNYIKNLSADVYIIDVKDDKSFMIRKTC